MKKAIAWLLAIVMAVCVGTAYAENLYVRATGGSYGTEDGSSYENAFDGWADIAWGTGAGQVDPGDTIYICGTLTNELIRPLEDGTGETTRITISGACPDHPGIIDGPATGYQASFSNKDTNGVTHEYISLEYLTVKSIPTATHFAVAIDGGSHLIFDHLTITDCWVGFQSFQDYVTYTPYLTFRNNTVTGCLYRGVVCAGCQYGHVHDNVISDIGTQVGIPCSSLAIYGGSHDFIVEDNTISGGGCEDNPIHVRIANMAEFTTENGICRRNTSINAPGQAFAFAGGRTEDFVIFDSNIVIDSAGDAFSHQHGGNTYMYNNTVYGGIWGISTSQTGTTHKTMESKNNIFYGTTYPIYVDDFSLVTLTSDNNIFYGHTNVAYVNNDGGGKTFATWKGTYGYDLNSYEVDPVLVTPGSDFHLTTGSPAAAKSGGATIAGTWADYDGVSLPTNAGWPIGAYGYTNTATGPNINCNISGSFH